MEGGKLTVNVLNEIRTSEEEARHLVTYFAAEYNGQEHYEYLGASTVMSATNTVNTIIGSANYLEEQFVMPDEIHVERLVDWFITNKDYEGDRYILTYYFALYIKRKINELYRSIKRKELRTTLTIFGSSVSRKELKRQICKREKSGVKMIR
jgi:hypothetical protein